MKLYFNDTNIDIPVNDNSYRYRAIKGEHALTLYYSLPEHVEIPLGAYCEFEGETYTLESPENFKKHNTRNFEYTLIMESAQARLGKYKFKDTVTRRLKFSLTAKPKGHLEMLVNNLNDREGANEWSVGKYMDAVEKVISYNHAFCSDALSQIAEAFETEWEVVGKTINLCKVEYNKDNPLPLSYGRGNGFKTGIGRSSDSKKPVEILFVQGGARNIDASKYPEGSEIKSTELLLPQSNKTQIQTIGYDGEHFSDQQGYDAAKARIYVTDEDGFSIRRFDKPLFSHAEDSLDCSHIYPSRVGTISAVEVIDAGKHFYDFIDISIPDDLDYSQYRIGGERITVIFQDKILAGKEFEIDQTDDDVPGYVHTQRRFKLLSQEIDGQTMPNDIFKPVVDGKYAVFGISMPQSYICNNTTKSGASWDMFREAVKYMYENEEQKFTFTGELDGIWSKKDWLNIGGKIKLGAYILFTDNQFQPDGVLIRIVGIKDYINNPYSPQIELSNEIVGSSITSDLQKIETNEVFVDDLHNNALQFTKRLFRDAQETSRMLEAAMLTNFTNFTNSISPITVQTMQLLVGDKSLQFQFADRIPANDADIPQRITHKVTYGADKVLRSIFPVTGGDDLEFGVLQHFTVGITDIKNTHAPTEYSYWKIYPYSSPPLSEAEKPYYLYAECSKTAKTGQFILSNTSIDMKSNPEYYYFLVALVGSEYEGERSVVTLYGFTEILPGRITVERIVSADGKTYLDLIKGESGGRMNFKDGLVSGDIGIGNENGINAGMSGTGNANSDIRLWAGSTKENRENAPFRVMQDGALVANNATIEGTVNATDGEFNGKVSLANGKILLNKDGSGKLANGNVAWDANGNISLVGKLESSLSGKRVTIDPSDDDKIKFYDSNGNVIISIGFYDDSAYYPDSSIIFGQITLYRYHQNERNRSLTIDPHFGISWYDYDENKELDI
jgi:hypothetical protein